MSRATTPDGARSFIRTGGQWIPGKCEAPEPCRSYSPWPCCAHYRHGYYQGGTLEPGRFTGKLAPMPRVIFPTLDKVPPPPDYSSPAQVMMRAREAGTGHYLPLRGEQLGRAFLAALRATGDDWRRPVDFPNRPEVGATFDWAAAAHDVAERGWR